MYKIESKRSALGNYSIWVVYLCGFWVCKHLDQFDTKEEAEAFVKARATLKSEVSYYNEYGELLPKRGWA